MSRRLFAVALAILAVAGAGFVAPRHAAAQQDAATQLAERHAPIVSVQQHTTACGPGEPYSPTVVEAVLGQPDVVLRDANGAVIVQSPTAADLFAAGADTYVDIPGDALSPGCDYETWFHNSGFAESPTTYARVATDPDEPGRLVLQYWLWWVYNDWNDKHEGDWEMLQIVFEADSAEEALATAQVEVMVAQHEGGERRPWDNVERVGDRPVVYPGRGSHATYYTADRWFGKSSQSGFGCDDTRSPSTRIEPAVVMLPDEVSGPDDPFAWLQFQGHWGEEQPSFNNGPTGPITKSQWENPIVWLEDEGRTDAVNLPPLGTSVTDFFCTAAEKGSLLFLKFLDTPWLVALAIIAVVALIVFLVRATRWSPSDPLPIVAVRGNGQVLRAAGVLVRRRWRRFAPIGVLVSLGGIVASVLQNLVLRIGSLDAVADVLDRGSASSAFFALLVGALVSIPVTILALTAAIRLTSDLDQPSEGWRTWLGAAVRSRALVPTIVLGAIVLFSGFLLPLAIFLFVIWMAAPPAADREEIGGVRPFGRSAALTRGRRWPLVALAIVTVTVALFTGPFVGTLVLLVTDSSFTVVNVIAALFSAVLIPWAAVVLVLTHGDLTARHAAADAAA